MGAAFRFLFLCIGNDVLRFRITFCHMLMDAFVHFSITVRYMFMGTGRFRRSLGVAAIRRVSGVVFTQAAHICNTHIRHTICIDGWNAGKNQQNAGKRQAH